MFAALATSNVRLIDLRALPLDRCFSIALSRLSELGLLYIDADSKPLDPVSDGVVRLVSDFLYRDSNSKFKNFLLVFDEEADSAAILTISDFEMEEPLRDFERTLS